MKKLVVLFIVIQVLSSANTYAQKKAGLDGVAVATGAFAIAAAISAIDQYIEIFELQATQYMLQEHPETSNFEIKMLQLDGVKLSDVSNVSCVAFTIKCLDPSTKSVSENKVLLMFLSRGWVNQNGLDIRKVRFKLFVQDEWDAMFLDYINLASPINIVDSHKIPIFKNIPESRFVNDVNHFKLLGSESSSPYYEKTQIQTQLGDLTLTNSGLDYTYLDSKLGVYRTELALPFIKINGDTYAAKDFSPEFKIVYNEKTMGIYIKSLKELVQIKRATINQVHSFLHNRYYQVF